MALAIEQPKSGKAAAVSCEIITLNRTAARHLLDTSTFPLQRSLDPNNIARLANEMRQGWYIDGTQIFFAVLPGGELYLLNSHHSLEALIQANATQTFTATYHKVANLAEAGRLYARFDLHKRRTWSDAYKAAGFAEDHNLPRNWLNGLGAAVRLIMTGFNPSRDSAPDILASREMQLRLFEQYLPAALLYLDSQAHKSGHASRLFQRSPVVAVGLELFKYQPAKAHEFFATMTADDALAKSDPRKVLLEYLRYTRSMSRADRRTAARAVALAWNAWYGRREVGALKPAAMTEVRLSGTPWKTGFDPLGPFLAGLAAPLVAATPAGPVAYAQMTTGTMMHGSGKVSPVTQWVGGKAGTSKPRKASR